MLLTLQCDVWTILIEKMHQNWLVAHLRCSMRTCIVNTSVQQTLEKVCWLTCLKIDKDLWLATKMRVFTAGTWPKRDSTIWSFCRAVILTSVKDFQRHAAYIAMTMDWIKRRKRKARNLSPEMLLRYINKQNCLKCDVILKMVQEASK